GDELIDHAALSHGARDLPHLDVGRPAADEPFRVEVADLVEAMAAGHDRNVREVGRIRHRGHGGLDTALDEFGAHFGVEHGPWILIAHRSLRMMSSTHASPIYEMVRRAAIPSPPIPPAR